MSDASLITSAPAEQKAEPAGDPKTVQTSGQGEAAAGANDAAAKVAAEKVEAEKIEKAAAALALKLPEGFDAKDVTLAEFKKMAAKAGLDAEKAQGFFDFHHKNLKSAAESVSKSVEQKFVDGLTTARKEWVASIKADEDFGGDKLPATLKVAQEVFTRYETPALKQMLEETGWGDHPEMVKLFAKIGKDLGEDTVAKKTTGGGKPAERAKGSLGGDWSVLYPNSPELHA